MNDTKPTAVRPTKKQQELLRFIENFIGEHGYSPSYREIMNGLEYTSLATVALHVGNLIKRGHLRKRDHSARSIEVVSTVDEPVQEETVKGPTDGAWLLQEVERRFKQAETAEENDTEVPKSEDLAVLVAALRVLGFDEAVHDLLPRLQALSDGSASTDA